MITARDTGRSRIDSIPRETPVRHHWQHPTQRDDHTHSFKVQGHHEHEMGGDGDQEVSSVTSSSIVPKIIGTLNLTVLVLFARKMTNTDGTVAVAGWAAGVSAIPYTEEVGLMCSFRSHGLICYCHTFPSKFWDC